MAASHFPGSALDANRRDLWRFRATFASWFARPFDATAAQTGPTVAASQKLRNLGEKQRFVA
jgi:hypothetical protein